MNKNIKRCKKYNIKIYFSSFATYSRVKAEDQGGAISKARQLPINETEIMNNLENWTEADEAFECKET